MTHTKDKLASALRELGLDDMANRAASGWYDDYVSPLDNPILTLVDDLAVAAATDNGAKRTAIVALRERVKEGDFDGTTEESEAWANSPEGQEALKLLLRK